MRVSSPTTLLLGVILLCVATALAGVWLATSPPWLGAQFDARSDGAIVITAVSADGPLDRVGAKVGDRLAGVGASGPVLEAEAIGLAGAFDSQAAVDAQHRRRGAFAETLKARPLVLRLAGPDGAQRVVTLDDRIRPLNRLGMEFWANLSFGLIAALIVGWVWALRPRDLATQLFALTGLSMLAFTFGWAVSASVELVQGQAAAVVLAWLNMSGAVAYGGAMIAFFLAYPTRVTRLPVMLLAPVCVALWAMTPLLPGNPARETTGQASTSIEMALIIVAIAVQAFASRKDPAAMAATRWLGLSVVIGAGAFIGNVAVPIALGRAPFLDPRFSLGFFVIIYVGMAVGLRRHKLFQLDQWAFRILFYLGAGAALLVLDGLLIAALGTSAQTALGVSLLIVAFVYLPFRDVLWRLTIGRRTMKDHEMFAAVADVALIHGVEARSQAWKALLAKVYEPLEVAQGAASQTRVEILEEGVALGLPAAAGTTALTLRFPFRGRGLFGTAQVQLAEQLVGLLAQIEEGRDAYARGVVEERLRIARDLHDDVGARLLSGLHRQDLSQTREAMRGAIGDLRAIVSGLSGQDLPLEAVLADLRHETAERLEAAGLTLDWPPVELADPDVTAPYRVYKNLTSAVREVVSNAIRHAGAGRVAVTVHEAGGRLELTISDDGVGLPRAPGGRRSGLANLERRLGEIGGAVEIPDAERGTVIRLSAPIGASTPA
ncbi:ATP-binding protein [Caulobacter sp.]|uniref:ATP-binding protein n=1 Tax=Caulobacter sp. TaxID=78 RepID=UPI00161903D9